MDLAEEALAAETLEDLAARTLPSVVGLAGGQGGCGPVPVAGSEDRQPGVDALVYPFRHGETCIGLLGLVGQLSRSAVASC